MIEHGIVYYQPGRFAAWPTDGNSGSRKDEILVLHPEATCPYYLLQVRSAMPSLVSFGDHELPAVIRHRLDIHEVEEFGRMNLNFIEAVLLPNGKIFVCYYIATPERKD